MVQINYSIIIPHYNCPLLLQRCIDSIPLRDDLEVIIVDDNSDPSKVDFNHFPGLDRPDTKVIFSKGKDGKGPGYARNVGLDNANGKWVIFIDSDDYFLPDFDEILNKYIDSSSDVIYFKCSYQDANGVFHPSYEYFDEAIDKAIDGDTDQLLFYTPSPVCKFIKLNFLNTNKIKFQEVTGGDDIIFSIELALKTTKRSFADSAFYCVTMPPDSLTRTTNWRRFYNFTIASCCAYGKLKPLSKETVPYQWVRKWWAKLFKSKKTQAYKLLPWMFYQIGIRKTLSCFRHVN